MRIYLYSALRSMVFLCGGFLGGGSLAPEGANRLRDFFLEDFDEFFVLVDDFLLGLDSR